MDGKQELGTRFGMPDDYRGEFWGVRLWEGMRKSRGAFFSSSFFFLLWALLYCLENFTKSTWCFYN